MGGDETVDSEDSRRDAARLRHQGQDLRLRMAMGRKNCGQMRRQFEERTETGLEW